MRCKNCDLEVRSSGGMWMHIDGFFGCNGARPREPVTYAEPPESPVYNPKFATHPSTEAYPKEGEE